MDGKRERLENEGINLEDVLGEENEILSEVMEYITQEIRRPGDVDAGQVANKYKRTRTWALNIMKRIAEERDDIESMIVYDPQQQRRVRILRKIG